MPMPRRRPVEEPYPGQPPAVKPGDLVWCRTAGDRWIHHLAVSAPRYDHANALGGTVWLSVRVAGLHNAYRRGRAICWRGAVDTINWPAVDVWPDQPEPPGPLWRNGR
jgi:hypothetical protein